MVSPTNWPVPGIAHRMVVFEEPNRCEFVKLGCSRESSLVAVKHLMTTGTLRFASDGRTRRPNARTACHTQTSQGATRDACGL